MSSAPTILIVDDQVDSLKWLYEVLQQSHFKVLISNSGQLALESIRKTRPDLILLDVVMPVMDGFEVCRRLKADPATAGTPVIFLSAVDQDQKLEGLRLGAVDFISKPFSEAEVVLRVTAQCDLLRLRQNLESEVQVRTEKLEQALQDKQFLMRELQHRVKNHLTLVSSLLTLTEATSEGVGLAEVLDKARSRVTALAAVYDLLYRSENLTGLDFSQYAQRLLKPWQESLPHGVTLSWEVLPIRLPTDQLIPLGLIVTELVTNALKYAFPASQGGVVTLRLVREAQLLKLSVSDTGQGIPQHNGEERPHGLGWELVESLSHQLKGGWKMCQDKGLCVEVWFPAPSDC